MSTNNVLLICFYRTKLIVVRKVKTLLNGPIHGIDGGHEPLTLKHSCIDNPAMNCNVKGIAMC